MVCGGAREAAPGDEPAIKGVPGMASLSYSESTATFAAEKLVNLLINLRRMSTECSSDTLRISRGCTSILGREADTVKNPVVEQQQGATGALLSTVQVIGMAVGKARS